MPVVHKALPFVIGRDVVHDMAFVHYGSVIKYSHTGWSKKKHTHCVPVAPSHRKMSVLKVPATDIVLAVDVAEVPVGFPSMSFCDDAYSAWKLECEREEGAARERLKHEHLVQKLLR